VKAGDPLADIDPRPFEVALTQAEGQLARDRAALANAKLDLKRYQDAAEAITRQQLDSAGAQVAQLEGTVKVDEGSVANARLQVEYSKVTAPISGVVGLRQVDVGNVVSSSDTTGLVSSPNSSRSPSSSACPNRTSLPCNMRSGRVPS